MPRRRGDGDSPNAYHRWLGCIAGEGVTIMQTVVVLGLGEAGIAITGGLCGAHGWREAERGRSVFGVDVVYGQGTRGERMRAHAEACGMQAASQYTEALANAEVVISVVTGEDAAHAARMARPWLTEGTLYADFNSITGPQTRAVAAELQGAGVHFVDVAVMGSFLASGHKAPLLLSGPEADRFRRFAVSYGAKAEVLNENIGDASSVKILRSVLMKGLEALSVECLVAARRQGLVDEVLENVADVDSMGFASWLSLLTRTHLVHAKRRMEETEKASLNLVETGVADLMTQATRQVLARTAAADLDPSAVSGLSLEAALEMLDRDVMS